MKTGVMNAQQIHQYTDAVLPVMYSRSKQKFSRPDLEIIN